MREKTALFVERPLGYVEHIFRTSGELGAFVAVRVVRVSGPLRAADLRGALQEVQNEIPLLRTRFAGTSKFRVSPEADLPLEICERTSEELWKEMASAASRQRFPESSLLWQVESAHGRNHELLFAFHHAISDSFAVTGLVNRLLRKCEGRLTGSVVEQVPQELPRPAEQRLPEVGLFRATKFAFHQVVKVLRGNHRAIKQLVAVPDTPLEKRTTTIRYLTLSAKQTRRLLVAKKLAGATMQGTLTAAMLSASSRLLSDTSRPFACFTNVSLRASCNIDLDLFGCFVYWVETKQCFHNGVDFWQLAREISASVRRSIRRWGAPPPAVFRFFADSVIGRIARNKEMGRTNAVGVSNLGQIDLPTNFGPLQVDEMYSLAGQQAIGSSAHLIGGTLDDRMMATLMFTSPIDELTADAFTQEFLATLERASAPTHGTPTTAVPDD